MDGSFAIGGVSIALVTALIVEVGKRMLPAWKGERWLGVALAVATLGAWAGYVYKLGLPADYRGWLDLVIGGLVFGLSTAKSYDLVKPALRRMART